MKRILIVLTSHAALGNTAEATGLWLEEFTTPYYRFAAAGLTIQLASPKGGKIPIDPKSLQPETIGDSGRRWLREKNDQLENVLPLEEIVDESFAAVFYPGGHGPMWDLSQDLVNAALLGKLCDSGKIIGAVCHGPAALLSAVSGDGMPILANRSVTGFSNAEERLVKLETVVPFLLEDALQAKGAIYSCLDPWQPYVVTDGKFVTGQNPQSAERVAEKMLELLVGAKMEQ